MLNPHLVNEKLNAFSNLHSTSDFQISVFAGKHPTSLVEWNLYVPGPLRIFVRDPILIHLNPFKSI